ncbi:hypothetical protein CLV71_103443 [Actinophytocola oryzae]|uniref:Uncharacterized protein n=2 Tax=Actinophytocola oryzae TaxID=502181 RepID=A0A4R7VYT4_9PSEU|nr:hypothetical protein CLV71_103443 [Actinophytocola oryzae]
MAKLTEVAETMRRFVETAAAADEPPPESAVPTNSAATRMATTARQSYQKTARWMLAAFAAVGILIFGSLPFAAIADVELRWPESLWLVGGLLVAVAGIVAAVISVSLVNEPEDVSLGELDCDLRGLQETDEKGFLWVDEKPVLKVGRLSAAWNPRIAARIELVNILHGPESSAHLGPNLGSERPASVTNLIQKLGELESRHASLAPLVARHTVAIESYEKRTAALKELLEELRSRMGSVLDTELNAAASMHTATAAKLDQERASLTVKKQELAEIDDQLKLYHDHRDLVLAESGVMQLRGTFRLARRILAVAAMLTLFGGTAYALSLPGAKKEPQAVAAPQVAASPAPPYETGLPAKVVVHKGTTAATDLPPECADRELQAIWIGDDRVPSIAGPFRVVVTEAPCRGQLTVPKGEGSFTLVS